MDGRSMAESWALAWPERDLDGSAIFWNCPFWVLGYRQSTLLGLVVDLGWGAKVLIRVLEVVIPRILRRRRVERWALSTLEILGRCL